MDQPSEQLRSALAAQYTIERKLGGGGMAVVYKAHDRKHGRDVALKVFRPELAAALGPDRFLREIEILARLSHPNILPLHDSGNADGFLYYVMPYVEEGSLRDRLDRELLIPVGEAIRVAREIADALHYAHCHGVVHRDVKPENILFEAGHAVISDFGIARSGEGAADARLTGEGFTLGTPEYMSPEQAAADSVVDPRSDLYGLACVLYEMLAGQPPFTGRNPRATIARQIADPVPPITTVRPELSPGIARVLERALAKAPADRYEGLDDFADALLLQPNDHGAVPPRSIAVLPLVNMSPADDEFLSDGFTEEIINALTKVDGLYVASRTSAFAFKGARREIREIGAALRVATVLEGSMQRSGDQLRVTAQLIDVANGYHLWSERYDRHLQDVFVIQDEIAANIVRALRVVLSLEERRAIQRGRPTELQAYETYLRGRHFFSLFQRRALEHARDQFRAAIEIDPDYARAHAGVADCSSFLYMYFTSAAADLDTAVTASQRAMALDPNLAEAHAACGLAISLRGDYEAACEAFERAIQLDPRLFEARYFFARAAFQQGAFDDALRLFEEAWHIREDFQARLLWAQCYAAMGRDGEAQEAYRQALAVIEHHLALSPGDTRALMLGGAALSHIGEHARAIEWGERALTIAPEDAVTLYGVACVFAAERQIDRAFDLLERAVAAGFRKREWIENDPDLTPLRGDLRFAALLAKL